MKRVQLTLCALALMFMVASANVVPVEKQHHGLSRAELVRRGILDDLGNIIDTSTLASITALLGNVGTVVTDLLSGEQFSTILDHVDELMTNFGALVKKAFDLSSSFVDALLGDATFQGFVNKFRDIVSKLVDVVVQNNYKFQDLLTKFLPADAAEKVMAFVNAVPDEIREAYTYFKQSSGNAALEPLRVGLFHLRKLFIDAYNKYSTDMQLELNKFVDWTVEELNSLRSYKSAPKDRFQVETNDTVVRTRRSPVPKFANLPPTLDFRGTPISGPAKDQGRWGTCWAFAIAGAVEGAYGRAKGVNLHMSAQALVDCNDAGMGDGGDPHSAARFLGYWQVNGRQVGLPAESQYPYTSGQTMSRGACKVNSNPNGFQYPALVTTIDDLIDLNKNEEALKQYLAAYGAISVAMYANDAFLYSTTVGGKQSFACDYNAGFYGNIDFMCTNSGWQASGMCYATNSFSSNTNTNNWYSAAVQAGYGQ
eukprot:Colp12_sorted_trinity150504_noHs@36408